MRCPLCREDKHFKLRNFTIPELRSAWQAAFGFDPYPADLKTQVLEKLKCVNCDLIYYNPPISGDKDFYARLSKDPLYYENDKWEFDRALDYIQEFRPKSLLEIGCGAGTFLAKLKDALPDPEGVDINEEAIGVCKSKGLKVWCGPASSATRTYDMIVSFQVMEHLEDLAGIMDQMVKLLSPGGTLLISVPHPEGYIKELDIDLLDMPPHHNSAFTRKTFEHLGGKGSLKLLKYDVEPIRYIHYLVYLSTLVEKQVGQLQKTLVNRIFSKLMYKGMQLQAPTRYLEDRKTIEGHTHLVLYQKKV